MMFVGLGISMEVAIPGIVLVIRGDIVTASRDLLEAGEPLDRLRIDIHVLVVWHLNLFHKLLLVYFLLEHFHLFLVLLNADMDAVDEDIPINYAWNLESFRSNHISKANILRGHLRTEALLLNSIIRLLFIKHSSWELNLIILILDLLLYFWRVHLL